jgi:hypothetical protein
MTDLTDRTGAPGTVPVRRLGRLARAWRAGALLAGALLALWGSVLGNDVYWPFGPMSQFAFRVGPDDAIHSIYLQARTTDGEIRVVSLNAPSVGSGRAEVEGILPAYRRDPALLGALAENYHRLHPDRPQLVELWLRDRVTVLRNGRDAGRRDDLLVTWRMP